MAQIIRVFHATTHEGMADEFREFFVNEALPMVRGFPGLVSVTVGLPPESAPDSFLMITTWSSIEGLKEFTGERWREAVIDPREEHIWARCPSSTTGSSPNSLAARWPPGILR